MSATPRQGQAGFSNPLAPTVLAAARHGDRQAQASIYSLYADAVYSLALRSCGCSEAAQEVAHDAFLNALRGLAGFRAEAPFGMWLRQIVVREALAWVRRQPPLVAVDESLGSNAPAVTDDPASQWDVERLMHRLPPQSRTILWLHLGEGYAHEEIAELFGKSVSFSKSQVSRSLERLRQWMR